jgi:hypothetical protein
MTCDYVPTPAPDDRPQLCADCVVVQTCREQAEALRRAWALLDDALQIIRKLHTSIGVDTDAAGVPVPVVRHTAGATTARLDVTHDDDGIWGAF